MLGSVNVDAFQSNLACTVAGIDAEDHKPRMGSWLLAADPFAKRLNIAELHVGCSLIDC